MWTNPNTGKGWTDEEEANFAQIQQASRLNRMGAIQLFRRFNSNQEKALAIAKTVYPPLTEAQKARLEKARKAKKAKAISGSSQNAVSIDRKP